MEKLGYRPSAGVALTPTPLAEFRDVFGLPRQATQTMPENN
jgi:hypothetical protein